MNDTKYVNLDSRSVIFKWNIYYEKKNMLISLGYMRTDIKFHRLHRDLQKTFINILVYQI